MAALSVAQSLDDTYDGVPSKTTFDTDSLDFGVDNRCSACLSNVRDHFVGELTPTNRVIKGYGGTRVHNVLKGTMRIRIADDNGRPETFDIPESYYVPHGDARLLSPQHWARAMKKSQRPSPGTAPEQTFHDKVVLTWNKNQSIKTIPLDELNVATFTLAPGYSRFDLYCQTAQIDIQEDDSKPLTIDEVAIIEDEPEDTVIDESDDDEQEDFIAMEPKQTSFSLDGPTQSTRAPVVVENEEEVQLSNVSAEFLRYHHKFNHCSPRKMQMLARTGVIPRRLAKCPVPVCSACLFGKATRRPWRTKTSNAPLDGQTPTKPGEVVSVDQMKSSVPGLVAQMAGTPTRARYTVATVFVDHATDYSYVHFQKSDSATETVEAKEAFERQAAEDGVKILHYHADNGVFASKLWKLHCSTKRQGLTFAGVGAHFQNGKAENKIRQLQSQARTMLIHAAKRWPRAVTANLWPYAVRMANESSLEIPSTLFKDGRTPRMAFSSSRATTNPNFWQPFACPVYVLHDHLQSAGSIHGKWKDRTRVGLYLGRSPTHARSVALVLNLQTGLVSPQFHVSFDPGFQTVRKDIDNGPSIDIKWQEKTGFISPAPAAQMEIQREAPVAQTNPQAPVPNAPAGIRSQLPVLEGDPSPVEESLPDQRSLPNFALPDSEGVSSPDEETSPVEDTLPDQGPVPDTEDASSVQTIRRSNRSRRHVQRLIEAMMVITSPSPSFPHDVPNEILSLSTLFSYEDHDVLMAYGATNDPDTLYYHEAMAAPDRKEFIKSMIVELQGQMDMGVFTLKQRSELPSDATILPAVWAMRRKRKQTTGEVYKHKSRLNIGGHRMVEGRDYNLTYAPVASWPSIRIMLATILIWKWHVRQIDYVQAYPQAPAARKMYMEIPKGCQIDGHHSKDWLLEIHRNIYGGKDAGRVWYQYLRKKLESIGFKVSSHDECVFYKGKAMYIIYTDDSILAGPDPEELDSIINEIKDAGLDITSDEGLEDFLGVNIERKSNGTFHLTQKRLINSILEDVGLSGTNVAVKSTPMASSKLLSRHPNSPSFNGHFNYRRVIGKLLYLEKSTRPDLAYAVHQCARFTADPKYEHGQAVKWIARYLKGTMDKGIILSPDTNSSLELFVDADFAGNWDPEIADNDASTAQSRHGYILKYCNVPVLWASQLQSIIALSTTEAEYIGLSRATQDTLPAVWLLREMQAHGFKVHGTQATVHCRVFEDNSGALEIATNPKYRPRTKHINQRYHFFRSHVGDSLSIHAIDTADQPADMLTKPLPLSSFIPHRQAILGW